MMPWLVLLTLSLGCLGLGLYLKSTDEVFALAAYSVGLITGLSGLIIMPSHVQIALGILGLGWFQIKSRLT